MNRPSLVILLAMLPAVFMDVVDGAIVMVAIPSLQRSLGASGAEVQIIIAAYVLTFACTLITSAALGDRYGRRRVFLVGLLGFTAASALCGLARSPVELILWRIIQGMSAGTMLPQVMAVIHVAFAPEDHGKAFGLYGATIGIASIAGPLIGGLLIGLDAFGLGWRSVFLINVPVGLAAAWTASRHMPESRSPIVRKLDLVGVMLVVAGMFLLMFPLTLGRELGWPDWSLAMFPGAAMVLATFVLVQTRKTRANRSPLVMMTLFSAASFRRGATLTLLVPFCIPAVVLPLALYLQVGFGRTAFQVGLMFLAFAIANTIGAMASSKLLATKGRTMLVAGCLLFAGAALGLRGVSLTSSTTLNTPAIVALLGVAGLGIGLLMPALTVIALAEVTPEQAGSASGVLGTAIQIGFGLGIAVGGAVFFSALDGSRAGYARALASSVLVPCCVLLACVPLFATARLPNRG